MATLRLDFLNKNMYRKYPIRATSRHIFTNGKDLPQSVITSAQITTTYNYSQVYISQIYINKNYINVTICENNSGLILGSCSGYVTQDQQVLPMYPFTDVAAGHITIGTLNQVATYRGMYQLDYADGTLEDSTVFCFTRPGVTSIINRGNTAKGNVTLLTNNVLLTETSSNITLSVIYTGSILSNNDFSGQLNNCLTPLIKRINTVYPDEYDNIDVYAIEPLVLSVDNGQIAISSPTVDIKDVCPQLNQLIPPTNDSNTYYTNILTATQPEWKTWPYFNGGA